MKNTKNVVEKIIWASHAIETSTRRFESVHFSPEGEFQMYSSVARCCMIRHMLRFVYTMEQEEVCDMSFGSVFDELDFFAGIAIDYDKQERNRILIASCMKNPEFARLGLTIQQKI